MADVDRRIPQGRVERLMRVTGLGTRLAADLARAAGRLSLGAGRDATSAAFHKDAAETLALVLGRMKGLPMKAGQMLSYIDDFIPAEHRATYREVLSRLQAQARPMRLKELEAVIREDLGKGPAELFARFDPTPIASASIGQVYRAALKDGREVAVKVQYPGIADAIRSDLKNIGLLRDALSLVLPRLQVERSLGDLADRLLEECDYGCELCNVQEFARVWRGEPDVWVPEPVEELCAGRVLVTELVAGRSFGALVASGTAEEKARAGRVIWRFVFRSLYAHGIFNADPHPGNYLLADDGRVAFIDFGCVQRYDLQMLRRLAEVRRRFTAGARGPALREAAAAAFGTPPDLDEDEWAFLEKYLGVLYAPVTAPRFRYDRAYTERVADVSMEGAFLGARKAVRKGVRELETPGLLLLNRLTYGLPSVLAALEVEDDWSAAMRAIDAELDARGGDSPAQSPRHEA